MSIITTLHDKLKGFRTVILGTMITFPGMYLEFYDGLKDMGLDLGPFFEMVNLKNSLPIITIISGILVIVFRMITKGKIGDSSAYTETPTTPTSTTPTGK